MNELDVLLEQSESIFEAIMDLETKSYFVKAYVKFIKSSDYQLYKLLKEQQLSNNSKEIADKIDYLETYGPVSDILYLRNSCQDVQKYINLKKLNRRINNEINFINDKSNMCKERVKIC